jgi:16S rRNA A1518/A1519 N6-dimethyltransferase RsmA/KsgA/DIM1 with predicted DNA glycosylase/AP lyase activity
MPYSYGYFKQEYFNHLFDNFKIDIEILDVGPGAGTYGNLLNQDFKFIDCIEIHQPYRSQFLLDKIYRNVFIGNVLEFDYAYYDYIILGDVLEHMSVDDAQKLLFDITDKNIYCMAAVPYRMPQGAVGGNVYETHLQDDLTVENFTDRYPMMRGLFRNSEYGYYVNYNYL